MPDVFSGSLLKHISWCCPVIINLYKIWILTKSHNFLTLEKTKQKRTYNSEYSIFITSLHFQTHDLLRYVLFCSSELLLLLFYFISLNTTVATFYMKRLIKHQG